MARILHLTHTDIDADPRILRAISAGINDNHQITAIGIAQGKESKESRNSVDNSQIINVVRPNFLRRKVNKSSGWDKDSHLEVSEGTTGPLRRVFFIFWLMGQTWKIARKYQPDIIHAHDTVVLPIAVLLSITLKSKVIYDAHELESDKAGSSALQKKLIFWIEKCSWRWISGLVTVSEAIGDWYFDRFGTPRAVIVLNSPRTSGKSEINQNNHSMSTVRHDINANSSDVICLYIGAFEKGRGIERLIDAFSSPDISAKLVLLGDGSIRSDINSKIVDIDNVFVLPPVKHDQLVEYIQDANYGFSLIENVSLSDFLCLPNKMFEYLNAGITIICSDFPEMKRVTTDYSFGYVIDETQESLSELLLKITESPLPEKISRNRITPFTWEAQEQKLQALYRTLRHGS